MCFFLRSTKQNFIFKSKIEKTLCNACTVINIKYRSEYNNCTGSLTRFLNSFKVNFK